MDVSITPVTVGMHATPHANEVRVSERPAPGTPVRDDVFRADMSAAVRAASEAAAIIRSLLAEDGRPDLETEASRRAAIALNDIARSSIEPHVSSPDERIASKLRSAAAHLEDANWQLSTSPSPDERFNGVDLPFALSDTQRAVALIEAATGSRPPAEPQVLNPELVSGSTSY